jgi:hypothetical protein
MQLDIKSGTSQRVGLTYKHCYVSLTKQLSRGATTSISNRQLNTAPQCDRTSCDAQARIERRLARLHNNGTQLPRGLCNVCYARTDNMLRTKNKRGLL